MTTFTRTVRNLAIATALVGAFAFAGCATPRARVDISQVPEGTRAEIGKATVNGEIREIIREVHGQQVIYAVTYQRDGALHHGRLTADGGPIRK